MKQDKMKKKLINGLLYHHKIGAYTHICKDNKRLAERPKVLFESLREHNIIINKNLIKPNVLISMVH